MKNIVLIGGGGHCISIIDLIENNKYKILGYVDKNDLKIKKIKYLGNDSEFLNKNNICTNIHISLGYMGGVNHRKRLYNIYKKKNFDFPVLISEKSSVSKKSNIGYGSVLMNGVIIQPHVKIGINTIINNNTLIDHEVEIGNHCHISTSVTINGKVSIGNDVFIGSGSIIKNNVKINDNVVVGMGSIVLNNIEKPGTYYGKI